MTRTVQSSIRQALRGDAGEGVISTGIAVLIMALIGAAMWVSFKAVFDDASGTIEENVGSINDDGGDGS